VLAAKKSADYTDQIDKWAGFAAVKDDILSFGISLEGQIVGQILLHDWDRFARKSLVGYHLYKQETRGRGIGKRALHLLQRYVAEQTDIRHLVAITTDDNIASQRICLSNGFVKVGPSREDPEHGMVLRWQVERPLRAELRTSTTGDARDRHSSL
jgi:RimJ/RimL family protein N-acetyltransferase